MKTLFNKEYSESSFIGLHDKINFRAIDVVQYGYRNRKDYVSSLMYLLV